MKKRNDNRVLYKPVDRVKEVCGCEIEKKMNYFGACPSKVFKELKKMIIDDCRFKIVRGLSNLSWVFDFDYYGYDDRNQLKRSFVLIHHPSTNKFWVRQKGDYGGDYKRSENTVAYDGKLTLKKRLKIINEEANRSGKKLFLIGNVVRQKKYFVVENIKTFRAYSISLDECTYCDSKMSQLEIEYKWSRRLLSDRKGIEIEITNDIKYLASLILESSIGSCFRETSLTKWEWILSVIPSGQAKGV